MPREYGCFMVCTELADFAKLQETISKDDLFIADDGGKGLAKNQHVTIYYGVAGEPTPNQVVETLANMNMPGSLTLNGITLFENDEFDVLKVDVKVSDDMLALRRQVEDEYDVSGDEYGEYIPHLTLAYLKSGTGKKYVNDSYTTEAKCTHLMYSSAETDNKFDATVYGRE